MKRFFLRSMLLALSTGGTLFLCFWGQAEYQWFESSMGAAFLLLWPAILLTRLDLTHTWTFPAAGGLFLTALLAWRFRQTRLCVTPCLGLLLAVGYCLSGRLVFGHLAVPGPARTPYDAEPMKSQGYLETYKEGYLSGVGGVFRTHCFAPEHTTRGFYEGMAEGRRHFARVLGRGELSVREAEVIRAWAARDGATIDPTHGSVEQGGPANGSQSIRSGTNSTSTPAGPLR